MGWNRVIQQRSSAGESESLQRRVRKTLEQGRHSRLDTVLNSMPDGVATTDADGRLTYTNLPMSVLLGLSAAVQGGDGESEGEGGPPVMTEQLTTKWNLPETDPLLAAENRDRAVVTELTKEENGLRRITRVARHPIHAGEGGGTESHVWTIRDGRPVKFQQYLDTLQVARDAGEV